MILSSSSILGSELRRAVRGGDGKPVHDEASEGRRVGVDPSRMEVRELGACMKGNVKLQLRRFRGECCNHSALFASRSHFDRGAECKTSTAALLRMSFVQQRQRADASARCHISADHLALRSGCREQQRRRNHPACRARRQTVEERGKSSASVASSLTATNPSASPAGLITPERFALLVCHGCSSSPSVARRSACRRAIGRDCDTPRGFCRAATGYRSR